MAVDVCGYNNPVIHLVHVLSILLFSHDSLTIQSKSFNTPDAVKLESAKSSSGIIKENKFTRGAYSLAK